MTRWTAIDAYASRTGTKRNLDALRAAGWGLFVAAAGVHRNEGMRFKIDNSAFSVWNGVLTQDDAIARFERLLDKLGRDPLCEGIIAPDIVNGGMASWRLSLDWIDRLLGYGPRVYLPVQPGIAPSTVAPLLGARVGVFVGGDSGWKESTAATWARLARERGAMCHVGRVNSLRRLLIVKAAGAHSFDGSGPSRFAKALEEMEAARAVMAQIGLVLMIRADCFFEVGGEVFYVLVEVDYAATIDAILLAAADAEAGDVFEVQTDAGLYELVGGEWVFKPWERMESET